MCRQNASTSSVSPLQLAVLGRTAGAAGSARGSCNEIDSEVFKIDGRTWNAQLFIDNERSLFSEMQHIN